MKLAYVQTAPILGATKRNLEEAYALIQRVKDADLLVLPELFHSGYAVRNKEEAESLSVSPDEMGEPLAMCLDAVRNFRMTIVAGFLERDPASNKLFNSAWMIGESGIIASYRKVHLFNFEKDIFEPGTEPCQVVKLPQARVGMQICFDWIFPEPWGHLAWGDGDGTGAQIVAHPANLVIPDACPLAIRTRAMENRIYIVTAGRVGNNPGPDGEIIFRGGSRIVGPDGSVLASAPDEKPSADMVTVDPSVADDKYVTPRNHILRERFDTGAARQENRFTT
jgi:predicted amidohydrolase